MGSRYEGRLKCPYCKKSTEFYYALTCGFESDTCEHCKKEYKIQMYFRGVKK